MTASVTQDRPTIESGAPVSRLLVSRRDPNTRQYESIGFLTMAAGRYRFAYLRALADDSSFRPLAGFPDSGRIYESDQLFPIFAERIMSPRRPDRGVVMEALGLGLDAGPFEVLARSGGRRVGDTIELVPVPDHGTRRVTVDYFVHGVRYMTDHAQHRITSLGAGARLILLPEPTNQVERRAILVTDEDQLRLGYVPTPLLDLICSIEEPTTTVLRANRPEVGFHYRLLVRTAGLITEGATPFEGPNWDTVGHSA